MEDRMRDLLRNAARCFEECCSPFCLAELTKMEVTADECKDLSGWIAAIVKDFVEVNRQ